MSEAEYHEALENTEKKTIVLNKRRPCEMNTVPYNTVILQLLKSNMNVQYVTGIYAMLTYLTSYFCKPEHTMSELMKKVSKEQVLTNRLRAYVTYSKSQILQVALLDYSLTSTFTNILFQFPEYVKQSLEKKRTYIKQQSVRQIFKITNLFFHFMFYILHLTFEILL